MHLVPLCSYHAYNRCDRAGLQVKQNEMRKEREGNPSVSSSDVARGINEDLGPEDLGFNFNIINRAIDTFPKNRARIGEAPNWRLVCEFIFSSKVGSVSFFVCALPLLMCMIRPPIAGRARQ